VGAARGIWIFRVVFYGAAVAFLAVHFWPHGSGRSAAAAVPPLSGVTSQGLAIKLRAGDRGVHALDMRFRTRCSRGQTWIPRWWPSDHAPVPFHNRGPVFDVRESNQWTAADGARGRMRAWMTGRRSSDRRSVSGVTRFVAVFDRGSYGQPLLCDSGPVSFRVSRTS
jgi:hypothetical protein